MEAIVETWTIAASMNTYLLNAIREEHLRDALPTKGRNAGEQFAHIHNVRLMWLKASAPELLAYQTQLEKGSALTKELLLMTLTQSAVAIERLIQAGIEAGRIKGFKPHAQAFAGYLIAHEAHHRSQIILALKANGHLPDKKILFGLWEWGSVKK